MDLSFTLTPYDLNLLLAVGIGLIVLSILYLRYLVMLEKTHRAFCAIQPDVHITRRATIYSNGEDILTVYLQNLGDSQASDIRVTVHGGEGVSPLPVIPMMEAESREYEVWIKTRSDSPLLQEKRDNIRLTICYGDQWGNRYTLAYPVVQRDALHRCVALQLVDGAKPRVEKPTVSFWRMRRCLYRHSRNVSKAKVRLPNDSITPKHRGIRHQVPIHSFWEGGRGQGA
ncbi:hypothetical protein [Candidatus Nitrospira salsa]